MVSFILSVVALVLGYFIYGKVVERVFGPDDRETPAVKQADGVDFVVLPHWKVFMIQFLNIAGTGPIFGAIMGAKFGPSAYLWIVFGCIFAGAVHDYMSAMLSMRHSGEGLPSLVGHYLGRGARRAMLVFSVFLLIMVGTVFVYSPALILGSFCGDGALWSFIWCGVIFLYYLVATMLPIDKIIGKIYPLFAVSMIFMSLAMMAVLFVKWPSLPEVYTGLENLCPKQGDIIPCLFITIACGAISGFHATQSPLMARCLDSEKQGRPMFFGAMITEGFVALIWATISSYFFYGGGAEDLAVEKVLQAPEVVTTTCIGWLGVIGGIFAVLGVVAAPITSGDTAFRSARLIIAEAFHISQKSVFKRLYISIFLFAVSMLMLCYNIADEDGFNVIWGYFGLANQTLSVFTLWTITVYLAQKRKAYYITLLPAIFMTFICTMYTIVSKNGFHLPQSVGYCCGLAVLLLTWALFVLWKKRYFATKNNDYSPNKQ